MRARRFAAIGLLGRGAITRAEALDACGVVRGFLEALTRASATIGANQVSTESPLRSEVSI